MQHHIFSPHRVCPLGAHVNQQHGLVTGFAIDKGYDFLLMLDCECNDYRRITKAANVSDSELGVFFSGHSWSLVSSDNNLHVTEFKNFAWIVPAYENVPMKTYDKSFLHDVPESMYKRHRDKMSPLFARRAEHFCGEHKRVREEITA